MQLQPKPQKIPTPKVQDIYTHVQTYQKTPPKHKKIQSCKQVRHDERQ